MDAGVASFAPADGWPMTNQTTTTRRTPAGLLSIRAPVQDRLERVMEELGRIAVADFAMVNEVGDYLMKVPGKLFRPTLVLLSSDLEGESPRSALTLAAVVELVHVATLVHDDAVDHSVLRRGMPTVNAVWSHQVAIILGDYLYSRAVTELARLGDLEAVRVLASAANRMSVGEMRQLLAYDDVTYSEAEYFRLIDAKTASLMSAACELGALAGNPALRIPLRRYGHALGIAFQITDDMLDYEGTESVTGKPAGLDLRGRKVTLPLVGALREMAPAEVDQVRHLFTIAEPGDEEIESAIELVRRNGGLEYARLKAVEYANAAEGAIRNLPPGPALDSLRDAVLHVMDRSR